MPATSVRYHVFREKSFRGMIYCDYCGKLLWGSTIQSVQCIECGYNCHDTCSDMVIQCRPLGRHSPDSFSITDSEAESVSKYSVNSHTNYYSNSRGPIDRYNSGDETSSLHSATSSRAPHRSYRTLSTDTPPPQLPPPHTRTSSYNAKRMDNPLKSPTISATSGTAGYFSIGNSSSYHIDQPSSLGRNNSGTGTKASSSSTTTNNKAYRKTLKQQLQKQQQKSSNLRKPSIDGDRETGIKQKVASPRAMAKAFARLVSRSGAFFNLLDFVHDICFWKHKLQSLLACFLWVGLCLNTRLLCIVPPLIVYAVYSRVKIMNSEAGGTSLAETLLPKFDESTQQYYENLEHMQQAILFFIRLYDNLTYHLQHVSPNKTTFRMLLIVSLAASCILAYFGRWLVLSIGLLILLKETLFGQLFQVVFIRFFLMNTLSFIIGVSQKCQLRWSNKKNTITSYGRITKAGRTVKRALIEVSVYENQRWWAGTGFTSQLLRSERAAWSNITGTEPLPAKEGMPAPTSYIWSPDDNEWHLDTTGPWVDSALDIVELILCDEQGWVYTNHHWLNPRSSPDLASGRAANDTNRTLTRRRRWYKKAILATESE